MHIRFILIILTSLISFEINAQKIDKEDLLGTWHHSVEEQNGDTLFFRPDWYELPRVRGRERMEFNKNCEFVYYKIAPTDGFLELKGTYKLNYDKNDLVIIYNNDNGQNVKYYNIILLSKNILMLKLKPRN